MAFLSPRHERAACGRQRVAWALGVLLAAALGGCGQGDALLESVDPEAAPLQPTYDQVAAILHRSCVPCHSSSADKARVPVRGDEDGDDDDDDESPDLSTCAGVQAGIDASWRTIEAGTMPTGAWPRLSEPEKLLIRRWMDQGRCSPCGGTCP